MRISPTKFISLLFFIFSAFYLHTAHQIVVFTFDENAPFNARTFPIYLGWAGILISGLIIILPEKIKIEVNHKHLDYKSIIYLILISIIYGAVILKIGYFLSTSLFLIASYYFWVKEDGYGCFYFHFLLWQFSCFYYMEFLIFI